MSRHTHARREIAMLVCTILDKVNSAWHILSSAVFWNKEYGRRQNQKALAKDWAGSSSNFLSFPGQYQLGKKEHH